MPYDFLTRVNQLGQGRIEQAGERAGCQSWSLLTQRSAAQRHREERASVGFPARLAERRVPFTRAPSVRMAHTEGGPSTNHRTGRRLLQRTLTAAELSIASDWFAASGRSRDCNLALIALASRRQPGRLSLAGRCQGIRVATLEIPSAVCTRRSRIAQIVPPAWASLCLRTARQSVQSCTSRYLLLFGLRDVHATPTRPAAR
jgi:hypothetical protein